MNDEYKKNHLRAVQSDEFKAKRKKRIGFRHTDEAKKKIRESASKRIVSEETKKKQSLSHLGKKLGEGHRENCIKAWEKRKSKIKED